MTNFVLSPGDIITVDGGSDLEGCIGGVGCLFISCMALGIYSDGSKTKKSINQPALQIQEIQQRTKDKQEYIIDPDRIESNTPHTNLQLENIIDPDANKTASFLLKQIRNYQENIFPETGGYDSLT